MALTAQQLYNACQIRPSDLGTTIVDPTKSEELQLTAAVSYIGSDVLPGAIAEASMALMAASGKSSISDFVACRYPDMDNTAQTAITSVGQPLFDSLAKSYGRSEVSRVFDTDRRELNEDARDDRTDAKDKLSKLTSWVEMVIKNTAGSILNCDGDDGGESSDPTRRYKGRMQSYSAPVKAVW